MKYSFDRIIDRKNTHSLKWDDNIRVFGREDLLPMWVADMDFEAPPAVIQAIQQRAAHGIYGYSIKSEGYYQAIIHWLEKRHGWKVEKEWIVSAPGVVPSLNLSVSAYTDPGDKILVQSPVYYPFFGVIQNNQRELINNPLVLKGCQYDMDYADLEQRLASGVKLMIFCNPHNPGGRVWQRDEVLKVVTLCSRYNVVLLSDEIHSDLLLPGYTHSPAAAVAPDYRHHIITFLAPSKTFNLAGLTASYAIIPDKGLRSEYKRVMHSIGGDMSNIFGEIGLEAAYRDGEEWLEELLTYLQGNLDHVTAFFEKECPAVKVIKPQGSYLVWLDCRSLGLTQTQLMERLVHKAAVGLSNGEVFGHGGKGFLRLNIACPRALLTEGLGRIKKGLAD